MRSGFLLGLRETAWTRPPSVSLPEKRTSQEPTCKAVPDKAFDHTRESRRLTPIFPLSRPDSDRIWPHGKSGGSCSPS